MVVVSPILFLSELERFGEAEKLKFEERRRMLLPMAEKDIPLDLGDCGIAGSGEGSGADMMLKELLLVSFRSPN